MSLTAAAGAKAFDYAGHANENLAALYCKHRCPGRVYAFGGLQYDEWAGGLSEQVLRLKKMGFDGLKMIEGKPSVHEQLGFRLDGAELEPVFSVLEAEGFPLLIHVGDPPQMWHNGSYDACFPGPEAFFQMALTVLDRHKTMHVVLAHFFFHSAELEQASSILDEYPNVRFDLTPGQGMYRDFTKYPEKWKNFFIHYADRIIFGTDNHGEERHFPDTAPDEYYPEPKVRAMRRFLEQSDSFSAWHFPVTGLQLPEDVLRKIYRDNFTGFAAEKPAEIDYAYCRDYYSGLRERLSRKRDEYMRSQIDLFLDYIS
jgi:predicted TIM-barrel fold metal-dependent hydrolase